MTTHAQNDLEAIRRKSGIHDIDALIAEVEALRERNIAITRKNGEYAKWASDANDRAEATKAHVVELAGALGGVVDAWQILPGGNYGVPTIQSWLVRHMKPAIDIIRTALAATPTDALERYKALENCAVVLRYYAKNEVGDVIKDALDRLDALDMKAI